jgi:Xaa-Pro dipeptidase
MEIKEGMVFAVKTYCPASDGRSAGPNGLEVLTRFPAQELLRHEPPLTPRITSS